MTIPIIASQAIGQASPPAEHFALPALGEKLDESGHAWVQFLTRRSLSCGLYKLKAGATDRQSPHQLDEVYYIVSGRAKLEVGDKKLDAEPGAVLFVAAGAAHRFVDIEADLSALVFFSAAQPTRGGMAAGPRPTEQTPYDEGSERGSARVFYWFGDSSAGQVAIDFGRPEWKPAYEKFLTEPSGRRWRFGENFWTTLDTNVPLEIGGIELGVGMYYLVLESSQDDGLRMIALDPQEVRERRLDAYEAGKTNGGIAIPLAHEKVQPSARRLQIELEVDRSKPHRAVLSVRFGPHLLKAPIRMEPGQ